MLNLKNGYIDESIWKCFVELLDHYKIGQWIYPGVVRRKLNINISDVYELLNKFEYEGFLESYYELVCPECQISTGTIFENFSSIPDFFTCEICVSELSGISNAVLIYKKKKIYYDD